MKLSKAEIDAIIAASPRTTVPFNKLVLSETCQARPSDSKSRLSIAELAASIKDSGVLQNLVVIKGARGLHEVCAGGRRLDALALLAQNADIAENYPVPVLVVPADQALLASLAENVFHEPMLGRAVELSCLSFVGHGRGSIYRGTLFDARQGKLALARVEESSSID